MKFYLGRLILFVTVSTFAINNNNVIAMTPAQQQAHNLATNNYNSLTLPSQPSLRDRLATTAMTIALTPVIGLSILNYAYYRACKDSDSAENTFVYNLLTNGVNVAFDQLTES